MSLVLDYTRPSKDVKDIPMLYESIMVGYTGEKADSLPVLDENDGLGDLYAPGYDNNGVADISAKCL